MSLTRREFLSKVASTAAAASVPLPLARAASAPPDKPNVLFIICDDLGWADIGVYFQNARYERGWPAERTPNLDGLAAGGARLTDHYCSAPVCAPARASLLGGVDQGHSDVRDNQFDKALEDNHTLATVLRTAGYSTAAIGKWGLQGGGEGRALAGPDWPAHPLHRGFDYYYGYIRHIDGHEHYPKEAPYFGMYERRDKAFAPVRLWDNHTNVVAGLDKCYTADLFTARAKKWIADHHRGSPQQPFFLYLAYDTPHAALELPTQAYPTGGGVRGGLQWVGQSGRMINTASGRIDSYIHPDFAAATFDGGRPWPIVYQRYATAVRRIDDCVGDLLCLLRDLGVADNTLIVFTADHGPSIESYIAEANTAEFFRCFGPFDGVKRDCWQGGVRIPAIAWWPNGIPAGRVLDFPSGSWDWLPTLAETAGLPPPARTNGVSLLPSLTGRGIQRDPGYRYCEYYMPGRTPNYPEFEPGRRNRRRFQMQTLRMGSMVGVRYDIRSPNDDFEIYHIVDDPKQARNLAGDPKMSELQRLMKDKVIQCRRPNADAPRPYDQEPMAAASPGTTVEGVEWRYFEGAFPWVPDLAALAPAASGKAPRPDLSPHHRDEEFALLWTGFISAPADGNYTFYLAADMGAFFRIHDASIIDADFGYERGSERSASVKLKSGPHPFRLYYARRHGVAPFLVLEWSGPGFPRQTIPDSAFQRA